VRRAVGADQDEDRDRRGRHQAAAQACRGQRSRDTVPSPAARRRLAGGRPGQREVVTRTARGGGGRTVLGKAGDDRLGEPAGRGLDRTHLRQQLAGGGPVARVLGQAAPDQPAKLTGDLTQARRAIDQPEHDRGVGPGTERSLARGGEGEHRAQAEHVTGRADLRAQDLLG